MDGMTINHIVSIDHGSYDDILMMLVVKKRRAYIVKTRRAYPDFQTSWRIWLGGVLGYSAFLTFLFCSFFWLSRPVAKHDMVSFLKLEIPMT